MFYPSAGTEPRENKMFQVKRNASSFHIDGMAARTQSTGADTGKGHVAYFAETTCGALTRGQFQTVGEYGDLGEALKAAELKARIANKKVCKTCATAAAEAI
jgi:hypothetical protein